MANVSEKFEAWKREAMSAISLPPTAFEVYEAGWRVGWRDAIEDAAKVCEGRVEYCDRVGEPERESEAALLEGEIRELAP